MLRLSSRDWGTLVTSTFVGVMQWKNKLVKSLIQFAIIWKNANSTKKY